jgi:hypothetical protein
VPSEQSRGRGLGRVAFATLGFALFAPVGLCVVPLGALLLASRPRQRGEILGAAAVAALALVWLAQPGEPPDQLARAAAVLGGATFVLATFYTRSTVTHRALLAVTAAALAMLVLFPILGWSWPQVRWWVEHRTGFAVRLALAQVAATGAPGAAPVADMERWFETGVRFLANQYAAVLAIQMLAGLALAATVYYRVCRSPAGLPPGPFRDFRFSEHLGWVGALGLLIMLVPRLAVAKAAAINLLLVSGLLYAIRGAAVTVFGIALLGGAGCGTAALFGLLAMFILPAVVAGAIVLGVIDAGMDLRRRWAAPAA